MVFVFHDLAVWEQQIGFYTIFTEKMQTSPKSLWLNINRCWRLTGSSLNSQNWCWYSAVSWRNADNSPPHYQNLKMSWQVTFSFFVSWFLLLFFGVWFVGNQAAKHWKQTHTMQEKKKEERCHSCRDKLNACVCVCACACLWVSVPSCRPSVLTQMAKLQRSLFLDFGWRKSGE